MQSHEYKVVAAPRHGLKAKGVRSPEARFALGVEAEINRLAAEGWEYLRSDTLPCEARQGWLGGRATVPRTVLVFRRALAGPAAPYAPPVAPADAAPALPPFLSPPAVALDAAPQRAHPSPAVAGPRRIATPPLARPAMPPIAPPVAAPAPRGAPGDPLAVPEPRPAPPLDGPERP